VVIRPRFVAAALIGLAAIRPAPAQEPGRLHLEHAAALPAVHAPADNQALADAVALRLQQSGRLHDYRIDLECTAGVVELTGSVTDATQCEEALRMVRSVPGVERVVNRLRVGGVVLTQAAEPAAPPVRLPDALPGPVTPPDAEPKQNDTQLRDPVPLFAAPQGTAGPAATARDANPPKMPPFAWPTYAPYPNFSRVAYPTAYPYNAWPYIGPVYPFPKVPLGWRSVKLEFEDGYWWFSRVANKHNWWRLRYW
jgi:hypothetical protein